MLSVRPKITELKFSVLARAVHPELFDAHASRTMARTHYELQLHITSSGHLIRLDSGGKILTEVCAGAHHPLPTQHRIICEGIDRPMTREASIDGVIEYSSQFELEGVNPKTFLTIQKQLDARKPCEGLVHRFEPGNRIPFGAVSYINIQSFAKHVKIRSFHTFPDTCAVMKSETLIHVHPVSIPRNEGDDAEKS